MRRGAVLGLVMGCLGCGAGAIVKSPLADKCTSAGLRGCDDLTDGIVLYVDGQKQLGYDKVKQGVAVNLDNPSQVKAFAMGMKLLESAPGVGPYIKQMRPIIDMMDAAADDAIKNGRGRRRDDDDGDEKPKRSASAPQAPADAKTPSPPTKGPEPDARLRAGTAMVAGNKDADYCNALAQTPAGSVGGTKCVTAIAGPLTVTDLRAPGGCPNEMIVLAGDAQKPKWFVFVPANGSVTIDGALLALGGDDELTIAARPGATNTLRTDPACAITWAGYR